MPQPHTARTRHLARLAWIGALVLVLRLAGAELHHVLEAHDPGEACEACLVLERGGHALPSTAAAVALPPPANTAAARAPAPPVAALILAPLPRGPPLLSI